MHTLPGRKAIRLPKFDYRTPGWYFITCITHNRTPHFGSTTAAGLEIGLVGHIARHEWLACTRHNPHTHLDAFVVMPDHVHALIALRQTSAPESPAPLTRIVQAFKAAVARRARRAGLHPPNVRLWQRSFHDRVIRSDRHLEAVRRYIDNNPRRAALAIRAKRDLHEQGAACMPPRRDMGRSQGYG